MHVLLSSPPDKHTDEQHRRQEFKVNNDFRESPVREDGSETYAANHLVGAVSKTIEFNNCQARHAIRAEADEEEAVCQRQKQKPSVRPAGSPPALQRSIASAHRQIPEDQLGEQGLHLIHDERKSQDHRKAKDRQRAFRHLRAAVLFSSTVDYDGNDDKAVDFHRPMVMNATAFHLRSVRLRGDASRRAAALICGVTHAADCTGALMIADLIEIITVVGIAQSVSNLKVAFAVRANATYDGTLEDESPIQRKTISFKKGDFLHIYKRYTFDWWIGRVVAANTTIGFIPTARRLARLIEQHEEEPALLPDRNTLLGGNPREPNSELPMDFLCDLVVIGVGSNLGIVWPDRVKQSVIWEYPNPYTVVPSTRPIVLLGPCYQSSRLTQLMHAAVR
ncbi:unnamed protein product [Angiostrongylus costaricensis]|uniref:SH3 domain-containing protein n=1 Tax=Angiostrongylus costaricensis TaxID=334426 RepID=A0A0R3PDC5_ANGCS|nr:unnamed protein product [Angiostrongylus costaricensis]